MSQILGAIKHFVLHISKVQLKHATAVKHFLHKPKTQKENAENLFTILKFKNKENFENWTNPKVWRLYASSLVKDMDHPENKGIARNIIENVATNAVRKELSNTSHNAKNKAKNEIKQQLTDLENNRPLSKFT